MHTDRLEKKQQDHTASNTSEAELLARKEVSNV